MTLEKLQWFIALVDGCHCRVLLSRRNFDGRVLGRGFVLLAIECIGV